jgi:hypothetical protein
VALFGEGAKHIHDMELHPEHVEGCNRCRHRKEGSTAELEEMFGVEPSDWERWDPDDPSEDT